MNNRSELEQHFRKMAADALREHQRLMHRWDSDEANIRGILFGKYIGYLEASKSVARGIFSPVK